MPHGHGYEPYVAAQGDGYTGQHVALLTRVDPVDDVRHDASIVRYPVPGGSACGAAGSGSHGCSKNTVARLGVDGLSAPLTVVGREAQAVVAAAAAAAAAAAGDYVALLGDMNDLDPDVPGPDGGAPITHALSLLRAATDPPMVSAAAAVAPELRWSEWWDRDEDCAEGAGEHSLLDHLLLDPALAALVVPDSARIHNDWAGACPDGGG
eukprot:gene21950-35746_t